MNQSRKPKLLNLVAVLKRPPDVGTVVELLPPDGLEVEFLDHDGRTRCLATLTVADVLTLNCKRTPIG